MLLRLTIRLRMYRMLIWEGELSLSKRLRRESFSLFAIVQDFCKKRSTNTIMLTAISSFTYLFKTSIIFCGLNNSSINKYTSVQGL